MRIPTRRPRRSPASAWPAWTDEVRWTLGPDSPDLDDPDAPPAGRLVCSCGHVLIEHAASGPDRFAEVACNSCGAAERPTLDRPSPSIIDEALKDGSPPF